MPDPQPRSIWPHSDLPATLTVYPCDSGGRSCVMVLPGGGYQHLAQHEGVDVALRCNEAGFHAAVLRYSLAPRHRHPQMIHDAQRAARLLRVRGLEWGVDAVRLAVLGFSAGGHLAGTLAVHPETFTCPNDDLAPHVSARVDAAVLCYAVMDLLDPMNVHTGSRNSLMPPDVDEQTLNLMSPNRNVTPATPPTFLWHTRDDASVPAANAVLYAQACQAQGVPYELHVYETGKHGLGLATQQPPVDSWFNLAMHFLRRHLA